MQSTVPKKNWRDYPVHSPQFLFSSPCLLSFAVCNYFSSCLCFQACTTDNFFPAFNMLKASAASSWLCVPLWFLGLDNWASNILPSLRKSRHWCSHTVLPVQVQPYGLAAGRLQSVHCFVWSGFDHCQHEGKLSSQEEC